VPNRPKTPVRSVRVSDQIWSVLKRIARSRGETVTSVVVSALREYAERWLAAQGESADLGD